jgi:hypothetical protein
MEFDFQRNRIIELRIMLPMLVCPLADSLKR